MSMVRSFLVAGGLSLGLFPVAVQAAPVVGPAAVNAAKEFFVNVGVPEANIKYVNDMGAGHAFITENFGNPCDVPSRPPYISHCKYDQAKAILQHLYGDPKPVDAQYAGKPGQLLKFSQAPFAKQATGYATNSMALGTAFLDPNAYLYVPAACAGGDSCKVHVAFHGCRQSASKLRLNGLDELTFIDHAGYNQWADQYKVVVLYPQAAASPTLNPKGCWDWWGYTDKGRSDFGTNSHYAYKDGYQMQSVKEMIDALAAVNSAAAEH